MTDETAISGTRRQYKEMADGTLRVQIDVDPRFKQDFLRLFPEIDMPVALAPLAADFEKPKEEEKPKGGPLSQSAAMLGNSEQFQKFIRETYPFEWNSLPRDIDMSAAVKIFLQDRLGIGSRAELDHHQESAKRFHELMREYREWLGDK